MKLDAEFVTWAYRILLEREPESVEVVERIVAKNLTPIEYVRNVLTCEEFSRKHIIENSNIRSLVLGRGRDFAASGKSYGFIHILAGY